MKSYSLFELNEYLRRVVALNFQDVFWVRCEIAQLSISRGHYYLDLVEKEEAIIAKANAIIWAKDYRRLRRKSGKVIEQILREGMEVLLQMRVEFHEVYGLRYFVQEVDTDYTLGQLELQKRQILDHLQSKNLLHKNNQITLPSVLQRIAVISSESAAGFQDFLKQLETNPYGYFIDNQLFVTAMQGARVEKEILQQLQNIASQKENFDVVAIIRGGGARLDLMAFDNEKIGETVANFPLPVLTGIGHDIDETVIDVVAHTALKTPTAVADFLIQHNLFFENRLLEMVSKVGQLAQQQLLEQLFFLQNLEQKLQLESRSKIQSAHQMLTYIEGEFPKHLNYFFKKEKKQLNHLEELFQMLSPEKTLARGFSIVSQKGKIITSKNAVQEDEALTIQLKDGIIKSILKNE